MSLMQRMAVTLAVIGLLSGGGLALIAKWANPLINENALKETQKAIYEVQKDGKKYEKINSKDLEAYKVFDSNNSLIGFAIAPFGNGFQGKVRLMVGTKLDMKTIVGLKVLEQSETPGLGTKVTEEPFIQQFLGISVDKTISWVKGIAPNKENCEIQAITGATISSKAVVAIINDGIAKLRSIEGLGGTK